jgi:transcriptional regulator with AAA-type ATPase domain
MPSILHPNERVFADAVRRLAYANPCDLEVQAATRRELSSIGLDLDEEEQRRPPVVGAPDSFTATFAPRIEALLLRLIARIEADPSAVGREEQQLYEDLLIGALYLRHLATFRPIPADAGWDGLPELFQRYREDLERWLAVPLSFTPFFTRAEHSFAVFFQHRLAGALLDHLIRGNSRPARRLRADIWHSIFPRELRWYGVLLHERMHEVTTLILGPSGTGKELVAMAIGLARFVPFDPKKGKFVERFEGAFHPLNLSAMPRDLFESEMFGHVAGAFTGAARDHEGWFEKCRRGHTVFLDELGEMPESVQVRLLRVLQSREFYRVGDAKPRRFDGRVIAATNRNLDELIGAGRFREDLYFRLCSDVIRTPTLREQLADSLDELPVLVSHACNRCLGERAPQEFVVQLTSDVLAWIERSPDMGPTYSWPGNFRELEQCVRSVMVRGAYHPPARSSAAGTFVPPSSRSPSPLDEFLADVRDGVLSMDQILDRYCSLLFSRSRNVAQTARRLKKHRVTVQARIKEDWVERFRDL